MFSVIIEILLIIILILANGYFALSEIALISARKSRLRQLVQQGNKNAVTALALVRKSPEVLSTIQIGITLVGIFAGAFGGATVADRLRIYLNQFAILTPYSGALSVVIVVVVIMYLTLIIGELVPKQIALSDPEKIALRVAKPINLLLKMLSPLVKILSSSTIVLLKLLRVKPTAEQAITEEEIKLLIAEGAEIGVFEKAEQKMVERIFHLGNRPIKDFMTPRQEIVWLDVDDSIEVVKEKVSGSDRSIFPLCSGSLDNNIGVIETKDILFHLFDRGKIVIDLKTLVQPVVYIDKTVPALVAIEKLKQSAVNIALITDKSTKIIVGIVTLHDILEAIVGEFEVNS